MPISRRFNLFTLMTATLFLTACEQGGINLFNNTSDLGPNTYRKHIYFLADPSMEGRGPGLEGQYKARDYLEQHFKQAGLQPAFGESYTQKFQIPSTIRASVQSLNVSRDGKPVDFKSEPIKHFQALGFSANGKFSGQALFIGYGVKNDEKNYNDFANNQNDSLKGKVLIAYRYEPMNEKKASLWQESGWSEASHFDKKAIWAAEQGAAALIIVNPPSHRTGRLRHAGNTPGKQVSMPVFHVTTDWLEAILALNENDGKAKAVELQSQANNAANAPLNLNLNISGEVNIDRDPVYAYNVAGVLPGAGDLAKEYVIVGAHYDHVGRGLFGSRGGFKNQVHPGADDNASGTSGMLLTAQRFASRHLTQQASVQDEPKSESRRTMIFIGFSAEEMGLIGSRYLVNNLKDLGINKHQIHLYFNLDMIGRVQKNRLSIWGVDSAIGLRDYIETTVKDSPFDISYTGDGFGPSDQASFYASGVPVLAFFTGLHDDYHRPTDTVEKITVDQTIKLLDIAEVVLKYQINKPGINEYLKPEKPRGGTMSRLMNNMTPKKPFLGVSLIKGSGNARPTISTIVPSSPADRAGIKVGDELHKINLADVTTPQSVVSVLLKHKPGDTVKVTVKRDGNMKTLTVRLSGQ